MSKNKILVIGVVVTAQLATGLWLAGSKHLKAPEAPKATYITTHSTPVKPTSIAFDKSRYPLGNPDSLWVVVNKLRALSPVNYAPVDLVIPSVPLRVPGNESMQLRAPAARGLEALFAGAKQQGINLMLASGYRSYDYQVGLYNGYVKQSGQAAADQGSARPGHSEHQTGLAADLEPLTKNCEVTACFAATAEGKWLAANAYKYGFIIRYPADKVPITGYEYEPWHVRFIGVDLATELQKDKVETLEEFFGLPAAPNYSA